MYRKKRIICRNFERVELFLDSFAFSWEQRKFEEIAVRSSVICSDDTLPRVEYEDIVSGTGRLNKDIYAKQSIKSGIAFHQGDVLYGKLRPYLQNWLLPTFDGLAVGDFWVLQPQNADSSFLYRLIQSRQFDEVANQSTGTKMPRADWKLVSKTVFSIPSNISEQAAIGTYFTALDSLITLHQRKSPSRKKWRCVMIKETRGIDLFHEYYAKWITVYKKGAIRKVTMDKYLMTQKWLEKLIPDLRVCDMNRIAYQQLLNDYAEHHERQTTMDFHHQLKGAILDAVDEGLIDRDPTRKAIIKGRTPTSKKVKYLNQFELHTLLTSLELKNEVNWDYFILLVAKTGMRFSEALALTPKDFDFSHQTLSINKTWDYKGKGGFQPTKNKSSIRKIQIDWQTVIQFSELVKGFPKDQPIFVKSNVYNSTVNDILGRYCERSNIPVISIHGLRHTHASLLLFAGVSIASVARRLGHSSMTTTQKTYLHIIQELENKDIDLVMRSLSGLS